MFDIETINVEIEGSRVECLPLFIFPMDGTEYMALTNARGKTDLYLFEYEEQSDGTFKLYNIEDPHMFDRVVAEYQSIVSDYQPLSESVDEKKADFRHFSEGPKASDFDL